jgi:hypothetical protein
MGRVRAPRCIERAAGSGAHLALSTATLSELGYERERRTIQLWNDASHLR